MKKIAILLIFYFFSLACASAEIGRTFNTSGVNQIEVGKTTESQMIAILGTPYRTQIMTNGEKEFIYGYAQITSKVFQGTHGQIQKVTIAIDQKGVVKSMGKVGF